MSKPTQDINEISQHIWPLTAKRNSAGVLEIGGLDVKNINFTNPTPIFVMDEADVISRVQRYLKSFSIQSHGSKLTKPTRIY